jgi:phage N-6-adenine-methyltransferase
MKEAWRQEWQTPRWFFDRVVTPNFAPHLQCIDAFASHANALSEQFWTRYDDALSGQWDGGWHYCNPPFALAARAVRHATSQVKRGARVAMLLLARDLQASYVRENHQWWTKQLITPRLGYVHPLTGKEERSPTFPSMLWISREIPLVDDDLRLDYLDIRSYRNA